MKQDDRDQCGYGWLNFNWLLKPYREVCRWHDRQTDSRTSTAQQFHIPGDRIEDAWDDQIDEVSKGLKGQGFYKQMGRFSKTVIRWVNRFFYEEK